MDSIRMSQKTFLNVVDIAPILGCDPQDIREQAKHDPNGLGFPIVKVGRRILIPRIPFLRFVGIDV